MKKLAVIGFPLRHSLSPVMHNTAIKHLGLDYEYLGIEIKDAAEFQEFVKYARKELVGFNVTAPYKNAIVSFLDSASTEVQLSGSANTVTNRNGMLHGDSTDGYGLAMALREEFGIEIRDGRFVFIGCGGAARAASVRFLAEGASSIFFINRTLDKAKDFSARLRKVYNKSEIDCCSIDDKNKIKSSLNANSIIIQSTPFGLKKDDPIPLDPSLLHEDLIVFDMIYQDTKFLTSAKQIGCKCANGKLMLLYQGAKSFSLWTNLEPPIPVIKAAIASIIY